MNDELNELAVRIREYCGIDFTKNLPGMELKVSRRLNELDIKIDEYYHLLENDPKEWDKLIEHITINETYFFREFNQLGEFQNILKQKHGELLNIWCIPCSTGEEAYSLAILAKELELTTGNRVRIIASDLNKKVLDHAMKGFYRKNSLSFRRFNEDKYLTRYFIETEDGYQVKESIRQMVTFEPFNLTEYNKYEKFNQIDYIFCRNVLFYFNEEIVKNIITRFHSILKKNGNLFLGHAESIASIEHQFIPVHTKDTFYYTK